MHAVSWRRTSGDGFGDGRARSRRRRTLGRDRGAMAGALRSADGGTGMRAEGIAGAPRVTGRAEAAPPTRRRPQAVYSGISQSGNQRVDAPPRSGSSAPSWAFRRSSRSVSRCLLAGRGHERVERAALEVVDEVERPALLLEGEHRGQQAVAVAAALELGRDRVERDHQVLEVRVAQDQPAVAELVVGRLDLRAGVLGGAAQQLLGLLHDALEVGGAERLEDDPGRAAVLEAEPGLERDLRRGHREQPVGRGALQLALAAEERVEEAHAER